MSFYRRNLPHIQRDGAAHFVTFCTRNREQLTPQARDIVLECCMHEHGKTADIVAVVVMPDHVHMIFFPLPSEPLKRIHFLAEILGPIKGAAVHRINKATERSGPLWQEESFDHVLRSEESLVERVDYILANPIRRGLARTVFDYKWLWSVELAAAKASQE
jgi:REP element-mobilizing transposase RayT